MLRLRESREETAKSESGYARKQSYEVESGRLGTKNPCGIFPSRGIFCVCGNVAFPGFHPQIAVAFSRSGPPDPFIRRIRVPAGFVYPPDSCIRQICVSAGIRVSAGILLSAARINPL